QPTGRIALLDVDPDLAESAGAADGAPSGRLTVPVFRLGSGAMAEPPPSAARNPLGYLVLKGLLLYEVSVCGRATAELLGPGDLGRANRASVSFGDASCVNELESRSPARDFAIPAGNGYEPAVIAR